MEKTIARWSYWLGVTCVVVATAWKAGNAFALWRALPPTPADISYWSFYNASLMFFATSIASACRVWLKSFNREVGIRKRPTIESSDGTELKAPSSIAA
jgi:heme/copper-type cytochrome/quinol oxidase subunit 1